MTRTELENSIVEVLNGLNDEEAFDLLNEYFEQNNYARIHSIDELDEYCAGWSATEIALLAYNNDFTPYASYFTEDEGSGETFYEGLDVFDFVSENELLNTIIDDGDSLGNDELQELLDEFEEQEEEEEEEA